MDNGTLALRARYRCFGGWVCLYEHFSKACNCQMRFAAFLPSQLDARPLPVLYWLSGLTCTEENFIHKAGAQRLAAELGIILVVPDTSPRGVAIPGEDDSWDFGSGAGFYLDATQEPWSSHYRMESYVVDELPALVNANFATLPDRIGISGHSMGGHGALVLALRHSGRYRSVSAFSPICAATQSPWGRKAFAHYLGEDRALWRSHDACALLETASAVPPLLVDQGMADEFLDEQLKPELLRAVCAARGHELTLRMHEDHDHSYYFVSSFMDDHLRHHGKALVEPTR